MCYIGGSRGRAQHMPPLWDPILSFLHTFSPKSAHVGGPCPPTNGCTPPTGNPGSTTVLLQTALGMLDKPYCVRPIT